MSKMRTVGDVRKGEVTRVDDGAGMGGMTADDDIAGTDGVLRLLREQASLYGRLESLASRQRSLVSGDDVGPLLSVLAERQKLSERLTQIATRLLPVRRDWETYRARFTPDERVEADRQLHEVGERLQRIIESDEQDSRVLSGRKQAVAAALRSTHVKGSAMTAYRTTTAQASLLDCMNDGV